ncbi:hypothetical protein K474DRAFT_1704432 [Panus rudis PR-1116 ss-1]|nr:hypothetical protein K474DRAFT_1704432 [Panus rudis PR-1116 ss-1]
MPPRRTRSMPTTYVTLFSLIACSQSVFAQSISTSTPVPPLQWINLTGLLGGSSPAPPLKDASIGYDEVSRTVVIFGGESQQGFPQSQTYLLDLNGLAWKSPQPPQNLQTNPPARSAAIGGYDFAASYRRCHLVAGGKDANGQPLNDVWEFDYNNQFWSEVQISGSSPSPRWDAVGGIDPRTQTIQDVNIPSPNNTFYLAGGFDGKNTVSLSDVWRLNVTGTLSANNARSVVASWQQIPFQDKLPGRSGISGAVVLTGSQQHIVSVGGCESSSANASCADGISYVINADTRNDNSPTSCPAPRVGPAVAQNLNGASSSFGSQIFMMLGTFDSSRWDDGGGLSKGEISVLDVNTGTWARVLPSGDPGPNGDQNPAFPSPREGAAAISFGQKLVGDNREQASDTLIFGGRDASGNYLSEVWILRAYSATLTQSNQKWDGFGNGQLKGGVGADGTGVTVEYMTQCAQAKSSPTDSSSPSSTRSSGPGPTGTPSDTPTASQRQYDTSVIHKSLAPVSVALVLPAVVLFRLSFAPELFAGSFLALPYLSLLVGVAAFGVGVGGLASAFTSITTTSNVVKRDGSSSINLLTAHGRAGLALFIGLYALIPILLAISTYIGVRRTGSLPLFGGRVRVDSDNVSPEKLDAAGRATPLNGASSIDGASAPSEDQSQTQSQPTRSRRARSWHSFSAWHTRTARSPARVSHESESIRDAASSPPPGTVRSFEVTNRPARVKHWSSHSVSAFADFRPTAPPRNQSDASWLDRRRISNATGEVDYALNPIHPSTPGTAVVDVTSTRGLMVGPPQLDPARMPPAFDAFVHVLLHALLLGLCILSLIALWQRAPKAAFGVFLAWTVVFYVIIFVLASRGIPKESVLSVTISRLRGDPAIPHTRVPSHSPSRPLSDYGVDAVPFPIESRSPYQYHQPPYRATSQEHDYMGYPASSQGHDALGVDDYGDEDDETRQRRIEEEMSRREVSIVTVPRRKLFLTNPEPS